MIVVPVLMMSCHVSEKPKSGPVMAQITIMLNAIVNAAGEPVARVTALENFSKNLVSEDGVLFFMQMNLYHEDT